MKSILIVYNQANNERMPEMDPPYVTVMTTYAGANASDIETNINLRKGVDIEIALDLIALYIMTGIHNVTDIETDDKVYSKLCESFFTYLRGLLSIDAIKRYDRNEKRFRKIFEG